MRPVRVVSLATRPPIGLVVTMLPPFYMTVWIGRVPYYYANDVYYLWDPANNDRRSYGRHRGWISLWIFQRRISNRHFFTRRQRESNQDILGVSHVRSLILQCAGHTPRAPYRVSEI